MSNKRSLIDLGFVLSKKKKHIEQPQELKSKTIIDTEDCTVVYIENFLSAEEENKLLKELREITYKKEIIKMFGKVIIAPREIFSFGDKNLTYKYAGKQETCNEWTTSMLDFNKLIFERAEEHCDVGDTPFNFVLINKYKDENDYIGLHSDNEPDIIQESTIASLSIGANRQFNFVRKSDKEKTSIILKSGSLLLMLGKTQQFYKHELPKSKVSCGIRYNLTFRYLIKKNQ